MRSSKRIFEAAFQISKTFDGPTKMSFSWLEKARKDTIFDTLIPFADSSVQFISPSLSPHRYTGTKNAARSLQRVRWLRLPIPLGKRRRPGRHAVPVTARPGLMHAGSFQPPRRDFQRPIAGRPLTMPWAGGRTIAASVYKAAAAAASPWLNASVNLALISSIAARTVAESSSVSAAGAQATSASLVGPHQHRLWSPKPKGEVK